MDPDNARSSASPPTALVVATASVAGLTLSNPAPPAATYSAEAETASARPAPGSIARTEIEGTAGFVAATRNNPPFASLAITAPVTPARASPAEIPGSSPVSAAAALVVMNCSPSSLSSTARAAPAASTERAEPAVAKAPANAGAAGLETSRLRMPPRPSAMYKVVPDSATRWALPEVSNVAACTGAEGVDTSTTCTPDAPAATYTVVPPAAMLSMSPGSRMAPTLTGLAGLAASQISRVEPLPRYTVEPAAATARQGPPMDPSARTRRGA